MIVSHLFNKQDIVVKKLALTQDWHQGLGGGGGQGFLPWLATMSMITGYFYKEQRKNKTHQSSWLVV